MFFCCSLLYYAPLMLIDEFGFDFYFNGILVNLSDLFTYAFGYFLVLKLKRKQFNIFASSIAILSSFALIFLHAQEICTTNCWNSKIIIELALVFVMRFFVSFMYQMLYVYATELYPAQLAGLGVGFGSIAASVASIIIPKMIGLFGRLGIPIMLAFCLVSCLSLVVSSML